MTTNKLKVRRYDNMGCPDEICRVDTMYESDDGDYVLYEDYEALQAEYEKLFKHLQNLIDQTTPLVPDPDRPEWSRRIQLDEVIAERDQLRAECEKLRRDADKYRHLLETVQGEPVAYISHTSEGDILGWERQFDAPSHTPLYTAPQPAEQQLAPDMSGLTEALRQYQHNDGSGLVFGYDRLLVDQHVAGLVEALERAVNRLESAGLYYSEAAIRGHKALAAYYKQGGEV